MSDDGYGYDCGGGDYSYDEPYDDGESYDAEDYTGDNAGSNFNEDDSLSYD
ncbi:hypothetical protein BDBG_01564 [Blastomyces gilchristii SLH14081]|uniref:Uncharacterized protein n=1 Tax=Blastomyces gilchristii (strain SLH14081) TaxID=559298 RepID=A0A179UCW7_BLAGS|nr:uncharacterized protein BDBG_01564 [Blastomyces gilchristii SLH14081]OAT05129.1 hypothetical protein BDBG_01564 [Blastomyces gilchristii SLH14081]